MTDKHSPFVIIIIAGLVALGPMATDMYLPALPSLTSDLNTNDASVQMTLSVYFFGFAIGQLIYGPLSDRFGRKPVLQIGISIFIVCSVLASLSTSITMLIAVRFFQAVGGCAGPVLGRAMVRDMYEPEEAGKVLSHIATSMAIAPAIAPIIGGFLTVTFGWQANFWFLFLYGITALALLSAKISETNRYKNPQATQIKQLLNNYRYIFHNQQWRLYTLSCSFVFAGLFAFLSASSFVLINHFGVSEAVYGYLFSVIVIGYMCGSQLAARLNQKLGAFNMIRYGSWVAIIAATTMLLLSLRQEQYIAYIIAPHFFYMLAVGIVMPLSMAGALAPFPKMAGSASSLLGTVQMLIAAIFGAVVGYLFTHSNDSSSVTMSASIAFAAWCTFISVLQLQKILAKQTQ